MNASHPSKRQSQVLPGLLLGLLCLFWAAPRGEASDRTWGFLAGNDYQSVLNETMLLSDTASALASGFAYTALGQDEQAAQIWLALLPEALRFAPDRSWKGILFFLDRLNNRNDLDRMLTDRYKDILDEFTDLSPAARQALWQQIYRIALKSGNWPLAQQAADEIGWIRCWQWVAGPFAYSGAEDIDEVFGPERDLGAPQWTLAGKTVRKIPLSIPQKLGSIHLEDYIHPPAGVAYCFTRFNTSQSGPATILLDGSDSARVWVNGKKVLQRDVSNLDLENPKSATCELREGANWILVKCLKASANLNFRLALQRDGRPVAIESAEGAPEPPAVDRVSVLPSPKPPLEPSAENLPDLLLAWGAAADAGRWNDAEGYLLRLLESHPDFALGQRFLGETYLMESAGRPGSRERLEKQAQEQFDRALAGSPIDAVAAQLASHYHLNRQTLEAAREAVEQCLNRRQEAQLPIPAELWLQRGRVNRQKGFWSEARQDFAKAFEAYSGKIRVVSSLVSLLNESDGEREGFELLRQIFSSACPPALVDLYVDQAIRTGHENIAGQVLDRALEGMPDARAFLRNQTRLASRRGDWDTLETLCEKMSRLCPEDPFPSIELARAALCRIAPNTPEEEAHRLRSRAREHLRNALAIEPHSLEARELDRQLAAQDGNPSPWYSEFDLKVEDFDDAALAAIPQTRAGAIYLIDNSVMEIFPNGTARMLVHIAVQLKNKEGRERFAEISIPRGRGVHLLWARTLSPDRSHIFEPRSIHDLGAGTGISMIRLEDNSIVDYAYEQWFDREEMPGQAFQDHSFLFGGHEDPMLVSRFAIKVARGTNFQYSTHPADFSPRIDKRNDADWFVWERRDIEGVKREQFQPPLTELVHSVRITTLPDYVVPQRLVRAADRGRIEQEERIRALAEQLGADLPGREAKIEAVYNYVQEKIEESGLGGYTVYDTLYTGSGQTLNRVLLARTLLDFLGIDSHLAFSTDLRQFRGLPPLPVRSYLSMPLLYIPTEDSSGGGFAGRRADRWIDFSNRYQAPGQGDARTLRDIALVCHRGGEYFTAPDFEQHPGGWTASDARFFPRPDGSARTEGRLMFFGAFPAALRRQMTSPDLRRQIVDYSIGRTFRGIQLDASTITGETELEDPVAFHFKGTMPRLLQPAARRFLFNPILDPANMADLTRDATRETPMNFETWIKVMPYSIALTLPEGEPWTFLEIPEDTLLISEFGFYSLIFHIQESTLNVTRSLLVPPRRIDPEDYPRFVEFCRTIDAAEKCEVVLGRIE